MSCPILLHWPGLHAAAGRKRAGIDLAGEDKTSLLGDYSQPAALGPDLLRQCGVATDYQWLLVAGPNTGTGLHTDPPFANSWNTLLSGHKAAAAV